MLLLKGDVAPDFPCCFRFSILLQDFHVASEILCCFRFSILLQIFHVASDFPCCIRFSMLLQSFHVASKFLCCFRFSTLLQIFHIAPRFSMLLQNFTVAPKFLSGNPILLLNSAWPGKQSSKFRSHNSWDFFFSVSPCKMTKRKAEIWRKKNELGRGDGMSP